eukprot:695179-Pelagomonas_calceolata.AAC.5
MHQDRASEVPLRILNSRGTHNGNGLSFTVPDASRNPDIIPDKWRNTRHHTEGDNFRKPSSATCTTPAYTRLPGKRVT